MRGVARRRMRGNEEAFARALEALEPKISLPEAMARARRRAGMTQIELAAAMNTTQSVITRLETGLSTPSIRTLRRLAKATGARLVVRLDCDAGIGRYGSEHEDDSNLVTG